MGGRGRTRSVPAPVFTFFLWLFVPCALSLATAIWLLGRGSNGGAKAQEREISVEVEEAQPGERIWPSYVSLAVLVLLVVGDSLLSTGRRMPELDSGYRSQCTGPAR